MAHTTIDGGPATVPPGIGSRNAPRLGGFNATMLAIELRRLLRNRRSMIFAVLMPVVFYFVFKSQSFDAGGGNTAAFVAISLGVYAAMVSTASVSAGVSVERSQGWSRQLRITPLSGTAYIVSKILVAMVMGLVSMGLVYAIAGATGAQMSTSAWVESFLLGWLGSMLMAAFGLMVGFLLPAENAMQVMGMALTLLAFAGGVFIPQTVFSTGFDMFARLTPMYGVTGLAHAPVLGWDHLGIWLLNIGAWAVIFVGAAVLLFRRDTKRV